MPLPPAPTKRAATLSANSLHGTAVASEAARHDKPNKARAPAQKPSHVAEAQTQAHTQADTKPQARAPRPVPSKEGPAPEALIQIETKKPPAQPVLAPSTYAGHSGKRMTDAKPKRARNTGPAKLFVLDTNVLMHDPMCLFRFEEHDVFLPMVVLEELDGHKKGMTEVARNARQTSRSLDALAAAHGAQDILAGLPLDATGYKDAYGRLYFQTQTLAYTLPPSLPQGKADNQILGVVQALTDRHKATATQTAKEVVLVSKDINMRIKARALGLAADDYQNDKTLGDDELLYTGAMALPADFWNTHQTDLETRTQGGFTHYRIRGPLVGNMLINQFVFYESPGEASLYARVTELRADTAVLKTLKDYAVGKFAVWGVIAKNREQNFALNLLMDPEVDFVTLAGTAGTGKTLMALASGLTQVLDERRYSEIIMTRATVSVGEDIGFLPGTEEEKMGPWMGALDDNLEFLAKTDTSGHGEWGRTASNDLIRSRIKIKSMNFMRGRTFMNKWVIIDEAQNLTPKQMKTLITRAGPGTKIICMGNLAQIDTPYLTEGSSGMTFAVDKFKGWPHGGHITLARGERSRLADFASEVL